MYGIIYIVVKDLVVNKFGEDAWNKICAQAQVQTDYLAGTKYDDQTLYKLVAAASAATKLSQPEVIEAVGYWFVVYIKNTQYGKLFSIIGANLATTLKNINALHGHVKMAQFHEMNIPTFRATALDDCSLKLQYTPGLPTRVGLAPLVVGLVKGVAELVHNVTNISINQTKWRGKGSSNDEWIVQWASDHPKSDSTSSSDDKSGNEKNLLGLDGPNFNRVHPFHFVFNKKLELIQVGPSTNKVVRLSDIEHKPLLTSYFTFAHPKDGRIDSFSYMRSLWQNKDGAILVHNSDKTQNFRLQGEFVYLSKKKVMFFICSPVITSVEDANRFNLTLTDFAIHDPVKDIIISSNTTLAQAQQAKDEEPGLKREANNSSTSLSPSSSTTSVGSVSNYKETKESKEEEEKKKKKPNVLASLFGSKVRETKPAPVPTTTTPAPALSQVPTAWVRTASSSTVNNLGLHAPTPSSSVSSAGGCPFSSMTRGNTSTLSLQTTDSDEDHIPIAPAEREVEYKTVVRPMNYESERNSAAFRESLIEDSCSGFNATFFLMDYLLTRNEDTFDLFTTSILHFYSNKNRQISFLRASFDKEIDKSSEEKTLFRAESSTLRLWNVMCETEGLAYFKKLTLDILKEIAKSDIKEDDLTANLSSDVATRVCDTAKTALNVICASAKDFPPQIQSLLYYIFKRVDRKFPGMAFRSIASLIFLRSLFPALLKPERYSVSFIAHKTHQKLVINVVKVLQNLVNNIEIDSGKGGHAEFNRFITSNDNQEAIGAFLESTVRSASTHVPSQSIGPNECNAALSTIKDVIMHNLSALFDSATSCPSLKRILMMQITTSLSTPSH